LRSALPAAVSGAEPHGSHTGRTGDEDPDTIWREESNQEGDGPRHDCGDERADARAGHDSRELQVVELRASVQSIASTVARPTQRRTSAKGVYRKSWIA
jgi:hypothetical protein